MGNEGILKGLTMMRPPGPAKIKRQKFWAYLTFVVVTLAPTLFLVIIAYITGIFASAWDTGDWVDFWLSAALPVLLPFLGVVRLSFSFTRYPWSYLQSRERIARTQPLRQAAAAGDDERAPLAAAQPAPPEQLPLGRRPGDRLSCLPTTAKPG